MTNDPHLCEPGGVDRYLPWSDDAPEACRLVPRGEVDEVEALPDEPIADPGELEVALGASQSSPAGGQ